MEIKDRESFIKKLIQTAIAHKSKADSTITSKMKEVIKEFDGIIAYHTETVEKERHTNSEQYKAIEALRNGYFTHYSSEGKGIIFIKDVCKIHYNKIANTITLTLNSGDKINFGEQFFPLFRYIFNFFHFA